MLVEVKYIARYAVRPLIVFLLAGLLSAADEWPQFRGNPQLTGVAPTAVPGILKLLWTCLACDSGACSSLATDHSPLLLLALVKF